METNKLLTLEEIEVALRRAKVAYYPTELDNLAATALAYWELRSRVEAFNQHNGKHNGKKIEEDKPHLPTIKVIVEAMKGMLNQYHFANSNIECGDLATFTESLEKHLE